MKIMTVVGTRPEIIRLSETIKVLDSQFQHVLVHTGQNYDYELNQVFFEQLKLRQPDYCLGAASTGPIDTLAKILVKVDEVLEREHPDAVFVLGDTNSALCVYAAKRRHIPIFHYEAGNRCFDVRVPEEINRKIIDHISDVNLTYSEHARRYLIAEGFPADRIIKVGSPLAEVINQHKHAIENSGVLRALGLTPRNYVLASAHREENVDSTERLRGIFDCMKAVSEELNMDVLMSLHPRTASRLRQAEIDLPSNIRLMKPFGFVDYITLQKNSACVVSDSGTITEEASILSVPAVTIRQAHERPEGMDEGTVVMSDLLPQRVVQAVTLAMAQFRSASPPKLVSDYEVRQVSWKIAKIIASYSDFVRREVWKEGTA